MRYGRVVQQPALCRNMCRMVCIGLGLNVSFYNLWCMRRDLVYFMISPYVNLRCPFLVGQILRVYLLYLYCDHYNTTIGAESE